MKNETKPTQEEKARRVEVVNGIIREIASRGRNFLSYKGNADFIFIKDRKLFYHSAYKESKGDKADLCLSVAEHIRPLRLLTGGTMQALVRDFCDGYKQSQSRIEELEAENAVYREALEGADELLSRLEDYTHGRDGVDITTTRNNIQQALKPKDNH